MPEGYEEDDDPELNLVLVNPEIIKAGGKDCGPEGCLSFPDLVGDVQRYATVNVRATDIEGNDLRIKARGVLARSCNMRSTTSTASCFSTVWKTGHRCATRAVSRTTKTRLNRRSRSAAPSARVQPLTDARAPSPQSRWRRWCRRSVRAGHSR